MGRIHRGDPEHGIAPEGRELEMYVDVGGLINIKDRLDGIGGELRKHNEIEAQKLELLKQIEKNLSGKGKE